MAESTRGGITRRQVLQAGGATFAGYAVGVDKALARAIKTDTSGIAAGEFEVKIGDYGMPVYEARPAAGKMPFLGLYGETDLSPKPEDVKKLEEMVKQVNKDAEFIIYPGAGHRFFADYRPSYNAAAADAWKRCTGLLDKTLKA